MHLLAFSFLHQAQVVTIVFTLKNTSFVSHSGLLNFSAILQRQAPIDENRIIVLFPTLNLISEFLFFSSSSKASRVIQPHSSLEQKVTLLAAERTFQKWILGTFIIFTFVFVTFSLILYQKENVRDSHRVPSKRRSKILS